MIQLSKNNLLHEAAQHGYRPEIVEKAYHLLNLIEVFSDNPYLQNRLALKGGTAINLFYSENLPRLSVDIDFNYIGSADRDVMKQEKIELENVMQDIYTRLQYLPERIPRAHAGGKLILVYPSCLGYKGRIEIDLNYLFRVPLWPPEFAFSQPWPKRTKASILNIHELAAGKLLALLGREASRDLFDSHRLLTSWPLDPIKLRLAFTLYAGMSPVPWQEIKIDKLSYTLKDIRNKLFPVLHSKEVPSANPTAIASWATKLAEETRTGLEKILPFQSNEIAFLKNLKNSKITPELLTNDLEFCSQIKKHPSLLWRIKQYPKKL